MSTTIEENVVVLKFDKEDFEKNVEKSINVLDKLNNTLENSSSDKAVKSLNNSLKNVDFSHLSNSIDNISNKFNVFGAIGQAAISKFTTTTMEKVGSLLSSIPQKIFKGGLTRALNLQQAQYQIKALGFTWKSEMKSMEGETLDVFTAVDRAVTGTAFSLDQAAMTASQILASNPDMGLATLEEHLKRISGVAAMTGQEYQQIGYIFAQVSGQGKLMGDQLMQLSMKGLNVAADLAKYLNENKDAFNSVVGRLTEKQIERLGISAEVTESQIREMVSLGVIDFETFSNATTHYMKAAFGANELYSGSLANLNAAFSRLGEKLETRKIENLTKIFNALRPMVNAISAKLDPVINKINGISTAITKKLVKAINKVTVLLGGEVDKKSKKSSDAIKNVADTVAGASDTFDNAAKKLRLTQKEYDAVWAIWNYGTYGTGEKRKKSLEELGMSYQRVQDYINEFYRVGFDKSKIDWELIENDKKRNDNIKENADNTKDATKQNKKFIDSLKELAKKYTPIEKVLTGLGMALRSIRNIFDSFKIVLTTVKTYFMEIGKAIIGLSGDTFLTLGGSILYASEKFKEFIQTSSDSAINKLSATVIPNIVSGLKMIAGWISLTTTKIKGVFNSDGRIKTLLSGVLKLLGGIVDLAKALGTQAIDFFKNLFENEKFDGFRENFEKLKETLKEFGDGLLDRTIEGIDKLVNSTQKAANGNAFLALINFFSNLHKKLKDLISSVTSGGNPFKKFMGTVSKSTAALSNIGEGLSNQPGSKPNNVIEQVGETFTSLTKAFNIKKIDIDAVGKAGLFISGIIATFGLTKSMAKQGDNVAKSVSNTIKNFGGIFTSISGLFNSVGAAFTSVGAFFNNLTDLTKTIQTRVKLEAFKLIALSIAMIAASVVALSLIPAEKMIPAVIAVGTLVALMCKTLTMLSKESTVIDGAKLQALGVSFAGIGAGVLMMALACAKLSKIDGGALVKAGATILSFIGMFVLASKAAGEIGKSGIGFLALAFAVNTLIKTCLLIALIPVDTMVKGAMGILALTTTLGLACRIAGKNYKGAVGMMAMSIAVGMLVPTILVLSMLPFEKAVKAVVALDMVIYSLAGVTHLMKDVNPKAMLSLGVLSGVIVEVGASLVLLSAIPWKRLLGAATALSGVMIAIGYATKYANDSLKGAAALAIVFGVIGTIVLLLTQMNPNGAMKVSLSLSALILSLGVSLKLLSLLPGPQAILIACGALLAGITTIGIAIGALWGLTKLGVTGKGLDKVFTLVQKVGEVIGGFFGGIGSGFNKAMGEGIKSLGSGLKDFVKNIVPFVNAVSDMKPKNLKKVKQLTSAMHDIFEIGNDTVNVKNLNEFGKTLGPFLTQYQSFAEQAQTIPDDSVKKTKTISKAVSLLAGINFPKSGGLAQGIGGNTTIKEFSKQLKGSIKPLGEFFDAIKNEEGTLKNPPSKEQITAITDGLKILISCQKKIPKSEGITQAISGNTTLNEFAKQLGDMVPGLGKFYAAINNESGNLNNPPSPKTIQKICDTLSPLIECQKTLEASGGIKGAVFGGKSLSNFVKELAGAAPSLNVFFDAIKDMGTIPVGKDGKGGKIQKVATAINALIQCQNSLEPVSAGKMLFGGVKSIGNFANELSRSIPHIKTFFETLNGMEKIPVKRTKNVTKALLSIVDLQKALPKTDSSFSSLFVEKQNLSSFGTNLSKLGLGVQKYVSSLEGVTLSDVESANQIIKEAFKMVELFNTQTSKTNNQQQANPANNLGASLTGQGSVISSIKTFISNLDGLKTEGVSKKANSIKKAINGLSKALSNGAEQKGKKLTGKNSIVNTVKDFVKSVTGIKLEGVSKKAKAISSAIKSLNNAVKTGSKSIKVKDYSSLGNQIGNNLAKGIRSKTGAAKSAGASLAHAAKNSISGTAKQFSNVGSNSGKSFVSGISKQIGRAKSTGKALGSGAKNGLSGSGVKNAFSNSGGNAGSAFVSKIRSWKPQAYQAGKELGRRANAGLKATLKIESPSKVFMQNGEYVGQGFIMGMNNYASKVYKAGVNIGKNAVQGAGNVSANLFEDLGDPVIRPVVDLSNVEQGANTINGLFTKNQAMSLSASINANRNVDLSNRDVVNAINELNSSIKSSGNSYNINGITYDDGSNVANAIETLVHASLIEGRI